MTDIEPYYEHAGNECMGVFEVSAGSALIYVDGDLEFEVLSLDDRLLSGNDIHPLREDGTKIPLVTFAVLNWSVEQQCDVLEVQRFFSEEHTNPNWGPGNVVIQELIQGGMLMWEDRDNPGVMLDVRAALNTGLLHLRRVASHSRDTTNENDFIAGITESLVPTSEEVAPSNKQSWEEWLASATQLLEEAKRGGL